MDDDDDDGTFRFGFKSPAAVPPTDHAARRSPPWALRRVQTREREAQASRRCHGPVAQSIENQRSCHACAENGILE